MAKAGGAATLTPDQPIAHGDQIVLHIEGVQMRLGIWWLEAATRGALDRLPIINVAPRFEAMGEAK